MNIKQSSPLPESPFPIVIIGAGGIVHDAHLPAYALAGFPVMGIFDANRDKVEALAEKFDHIGRVFSSLDELVEASKPGAVVIDIAVPANQITGILRRLPEGSIVLIQKPMGENLQEATEIAALCKEKKLLAAVNFQLRYAPYMLAARDMIERGLLGKVYDLEFKVCVYTPWELWGFLSGKPRVEILYHSIHYVDLIRSFLGEPRKVFASTIRHPRAGALAPTRSTILLDYPGDLQARISTNHGHDFGPQHQESYLKIEGEQGAIKIRIGLSLDYPKGKPSIVEYFLSKEKEKGWQELPLTGDWFPHAFIGSMASLQCHAENQDIQLLNSTEDALKTMKLVETLYESSEIGGIRFNL